MADTGSLVTRNQILVADTARSSHENRSVSGGQWGRMFILEMDSFVVFIYLDNLIDFISWIELFVFFLYKSK